jgi:cell division septum initiation protein DivIVA
MYIAIKDQHLGEVQVSNVARLDTSHNQETTSESRQAQAAIDNKEDTSKVPQAQVEQVAKETIDYFNDCRDDGHQVLPDTGNSG